MSQATKVAWLLFYPPPMISPRKRFSSTSSLQQAFACWGAKVERIARFFVFLDICDPFYPGIFFQAEGVLPKQPPSEVGVQTCRRSQNYSVFLLLAIFCTRFIFVGRKRRKQQPCLEKQNCRRSQTLCFYCYFRSSAICATFRFAEPRQSSRFPYIKNPSVSWDKGGLQGILAENALHKVPPSNKYTIAFEGA